GDDMAAQHLGEAAAAALADGLGPHDDAAHHADVRGDAVTRNVVGRGDKHGNLPSAVRERRRILAVTAFKGQTESLALSCSVEPETGFTCRTSRRGRAVVNVVEGSVRR